MRPWGAMSACGTPSSQLQRARPRHRSTFTRHLQRPHQRPRSPGESEHLVSARSTREETEAQRGGSSHGGHSYPKAGSGWKQHTPPTGAAPTAVVSGCGDSPGQAHGPHLAGTGWHGRAWVASVHHEGPVSTRREPDQARGHLDGDRAPTRGPLADKAHHRLSGKGWPRSTLLPSPRPVRDLMNEAVALWLVTSRQDIWRAAALGLRAQRSQ